MLSQCGGIHLLSTKTIPVFSLNHRYELDAFRMDRFDVGKDLFGEEPAIEQNIVKLKTPLAPKALIEQMPPEHREECLRLQCPK
jgi:hypothetical protein